MYFISLFLFLALTGCSLDNASGPGLKPSSFSDDVDFGWDLWPELEENKPLQDQKIDLWPEIKDNTVLFLGDESLQGNWGLLIKNAFLKPGQNSWFLSTCMTARELKNGLYSDCGFWTNPFEQVKEDKTYISLDQTNQSERLAPRLISDEKVQNVVISFGHRISVMESEVSIQQELSAIELLAKWAHSAGKKCFVIEPTDALYIETQKNNFLTEDETKRLRVATSVYCDWIDAKQLKDEYLNKNQIDADKVIADYYADDSEGFIDVKPPSLHINTNKSDFNVKDIEFPKNVNDPSQQVLLPTPESMDEKISRKLQEQLRANIEEKAPPPTQNVIKTQTQDEPRYLWNGHQVGSALTEIGKKYLNNNIASYLLTTKDRDLRDAERFCPKYNSLDKKRKEYFWLYLYSVIARYENDRFNPQAQHKEQNSGRYSLGIFQVDTVNCGYKSDANKEKLFDIDNNFKCALQKGVSLVKSGRQIADGRYVQVPNGKDAKGKPKMKTEYRDYGMDGYWSVLRRPYTGPAMNSRTGKYENVSLGRRAQIINLTKSISICK